MTEPEERYDTDEEQGHDPRNHEGKFYCHQSPTLILRQPAGSDEVVRYTRIIDGEEVMHVTYYFKPSLWERINFWLAGYKANWY